MRRVTYALSLALVMAVAVVIVSAQGPSQMPRGWTHVPDSSIELSGHRGFVAHTNHQIHVDPQATGTRPAGQTPASIWNIYVGSGSPNGGSRIIAIVDAYHYATALKDFNVFSSQFGLPVETSTSATASSNKVFQVLYATGRQPQANCGWAQEEALDIEWAHAMAPGAKIVLVEAASASYSDLFKAVDVATSLVKGAGGGEVSMSWGGSEFSTEKSYDKHFALNSGVVYFASSGDTGGVTIYPSASPYVVAAGGTTLLFGGGVFTGEAGWSGSGGGPSKYEAMAGFQMTTVTMPAGLTTRGVPDISFDADPNTGVSVYDSTSCQGMSGWMVFGGTSVSSPCLAGLANASGGFELNSSNQLLSSYSLAPSYFFDVLTGKAGTFSAGRGWDFVTGIGTPRTLSGF
jgi:kumamolisin